MFKLWNFVAYQVAWFAVILGAAHDHALAGSAVALAVTVIHFALRRDALDLKLAALAALIGFLVDTTLAMTGLVRFTSAWPAGMAPFWMLSLWIAFATTLNHSLRWLMHRPAAAAVAGALGGPLAYLAGAKLGALSLTTPTIALAVIGVLWLPAMVALSMFLMRAALLPQDRRLTA